MSGIHDLLGKNDKNRVDFDLSDEALADKWQAVDDTADSYMEPTEEVEEEELEEEDAEDSEEEELEEESEEPGEEEVEDEVAAELPDKLKGKSAEEIAAMYLNLESMHGKTAAELKAAREAAPQQHPMPHVAQPQAFDPTGLIEASHDEPVQAYNLALQALDSNLIGVDTVEAIINQVYENGNDRMARSMERDFDRRQIIAQQAIQNQPIVDQVKDSAIRIAVDALQSEHKDDVDAYNADIQRIIKSPGTLTEQAVSSAFNAANSAHDVKAALSEALKLSIGADPTRSKSYNDRVASARISRDKKDGVVEKGGNKVKPDTRTEEDLIREKIFAPKNEEVKKLFGIKK